MRNLRDPVVKDQTKIANIFGIDDLLIAAAVSAGAGLYSANKTQKAQQKQADTQNALNARSQALAEKMDQEGLATTVDPNGNITYYDAQANTWRTILAPQQQQINDTSNLELLRSLSVDAPLARGELLRSSQAKLLDQGLAGTLRTQTENAAAGKGAVKAGDLASSLRQSRQGAVNAGFDGAQTALTTQALRTGTGVETIGANLAKARANAIAQTMGNPDIEGLQLARDMNSTDLSNKINNYGTVANRAYATGDYQAPNPNITPNLTSALAQSKQTGANATGNAAQIIGSQKVPAAVATPNYSNLIASIIPFIQDGGSASGFGGSNIPTTRTVTAKELAGDF